MTAEGQIEAIRCVDRDFFAALLDRDIPILEGLLARDFQIVDVGSGSVHPRAAFIEAIGAGLVTFHAIETFASELMVRLLGRGTGIAIGRTAMAFTGPDGARSEVASRYTHVFQADGGNWQLISAQGTPISSG